MYLLQYELGKRRRALIARPKLAIGGGSSEREHGSERRGEGNIHLSASIAGGIA